MSFLQSLFGGQQPTPPASTGQEPQPQQQAQQAQQTTDPEPQQQQQQQQPAGVDALAALFAEPEGDDGAPGVPELNLTPELLAKATADKNFMAGVTEEMLTQVQQGDTNALMAVIQQAVRNGYDQAMLDSTSLAGRYAGTRADYAAQQAAKGIRGHVIESQVDVEGLSPAAQGMFKQIASKVAERNPTASAAEVKSQATALLQQLAEEFNFSGRAQKAQEPVPDDWSKIFGTN